MVNLFTFGTEDCGFDSLSGRKGLHIGMLLFVIHLAGEIKDTNIYANELTNLDMSCNNTRNLRDMGNLISMLMCLMS
jgi:hypothetical protein